MTGWNMPAPRIEGAWDAYSWRSEPQTPQYATSTTTWQVPACGPGELPHLHLSWSAERHCFHEDTSSSSLGALPGSYTFCTYWETIRCALKKLPLCEIALRITSA